MKQFLRIIYLVAFLAVSFRGAAYDAEAEIGGLLYGLDTSAGTATVLLGDYYAFTSVTIPSEVAYEGRTYAVTAVDDNAFSYRSNLKSISLPSSLKRIGSGAFFHCYSLQYVEIPASVQEIGIQAFGGCFNLEQIIVNEGNIHYCSIDGVLFSKDMKSLVAYPAGCGTENYEIPATVTTVHTYAFNHCDNLKEIHIPESVTAIGDCAFEYCSVSVIYCNPIIPPAYSASARLFDDEIYKTGKLFVPEESADDYRAHHEWGRFGHINDTSLDYSIYTGIYNRQCVHGDTWRAYFIFGTDVAYSKYSVVLSKPYSKDYKDLLIDYTISSGGNINSVYELDVSGAVDHTSAFVTLVSFDSEGNPQESGVAECVINGSDDSWETLDGLGHFTDGYMCRIYPDRADGIKDYDVTVQRSKTAPGCFRVVNPYPHEEWGNCIACKWGDHYLYINATDPDKVYVKASALGIGFGEDSGSMLMFTGNAYLASFYDDLETTDADYGTMDKNGLITLKGMAILGKEDSDPDTAPYDDEAYITLQLPASYSSGIDAVIEDDAEAPVEYYNLQGMRVHNIEGTGGIYIRRQGNKTAKVYVK